MSVTPYLTGVAALAVAGTYGLYSWTKRDLAAAETQLALSKRDRACVSTVAEDVNRSALDQIAALTSEIRKQKEINAAISAKSGERLRALNRLTKEISNVPKSENVPVSDHIERVLDELRRAHAGGNVPAGNSDAGNGGAPGTVGHDVPAEAGPAS